MTQEPTSEIVRAIQAEIDRVSLDRDVQAKNLDYSFRASAIAAQAYDADRRKVDLLNERMGNLHKALRLVRDN